EIVEKKAKEGAIPARLQELLEASVSLAYGLHPETEFRYLLEEIGICDVEMYVNSARSLTSASVTKLPSVVKGYFNNETSSLSELDRLVISHVPEGGNWQDIPESVPGQRLVQIREMTAERGVVRTTYYGRLRRDQPAYTINTYFNRPGNGTHIHPIENRTLTSREAARLQSFPDSYIFMGSQTAIRNQIGNAVPPLLAKAIGEKFLEQSDSNLGIDIFCGAGGLSLGLEIAGWKTLAAADNDRSAIDTFLFNRPCEYEPEDHFEDELCSVYKRDLQNLDQFNSLVKQIEKKLDGRTLGLMVGGPPCQGFSHAGFRLENDDRNDLASVYLNLADKLRPNLFLLENVEGLQTFKKGQVLRDIVSTLEGLGYSVHTPVWKLHAEQFGVPQMRRRVFVVASLDRKMDLTPPEPKFQICPGRRQPKASADLFESSLPEPISVAEALSGLSLPKKGDSDFLRWITTPHHESFFFGMT
ncbi:MAG: DNA (cytosine-5-)-methyltransferase, partial [Pseudomonadales bacterium]|nr:DNA (cytosine-5-)-methyltransferase [Pseudomonadales bacterium]